MKFVVMDALRLAALVLSLCAVVATVRLTHRPCPARADAPLPPAPAAPPAQGAPSPANASRLPPAEFDLFAKKTSTNYSVIWMSPMEVNLVLRYLRGVRTYLEWGSGGSTHNFPQFASEVAVSIEHNQAWCNQVRARVAQNPRLAHLEYHCVPVARGHKGWGITGEFEEGSYVAFREYIDKIDTAGHETYDFVLIDGRARRDAGVKALSYIKPTSVVALHDSSRFLYRNSNYKELQQWYKVVDSCGGSGRQGIAIMRRKEAYNYLQGNHSAVQAMLNKHYNMS